MFRYEEVIFNYAGALFETGGDALAQLNLITIHRGTSAFTSVTKEDILNEKHKVLIFEGFRFDDLMRTGQDISYRGTNQIVMGTISYSNNLYTYPIPIGELIANSNMVPNEGY